MIGIRKEKRGLGFAKREIATAFIHVRWQALKNDI